MKVQALNFGVCDHCGAIGKSKFRLCSFCEQLIVKNRAHLFSTHVEGLIITSLFQWIPHESDAFSNWFLQTKSQSQCVWNQLAQLWIDKKYTDSVPAMSTTKKLILIPCPTANKTRQHSLRWAYSLSEQFGIPIVELLYFPKDSGLRRPQKTKKQSERKLIKMQVDLKKLRALGDLDNYSLIFTDDLVTTGATAKAAHKALGEPLNFYIWSLAYRVNLPISLNK